MTTDKIAGKLRAMLPGLTRDIENKRRARLDNTPKRQKETLSARIEADHLERARIAAERLAAAREADTLPAVLAGVATKAELLRMLATRIDHSGGYYSLRDTGEFYAQDQTAVALRAFLEAAKGEADVAAELERGRLREIDALERAVRLANIPGFFPTPPGVIARMLELAQVAAYHHTLEPSAGKGDIADALRAVGCEPLVCECSPALRDILAAKGYKFFGTDFLECSPLADGFERIVMNPPFERGQDIDHIRHAYTCLRPGGRLVSVMSAGPSFRTDRKSEDFRAWFMAVGGEKVVLRDAFVDAFRPTGTQSVLVVIDRD